MPDTCAAHRCSNERNTNTKSRGITFHRFPKDSILRRRWELALKLEGFVASRRRLLCSAHFQTADFDSTGQTIRLRHGVVPSVFNFPAHLQKKVKASRTTQTSKKAEQSLPVEPPQPLHEVEPQPNVDHNYALPPSPVAVKARLNEVLARVESLEHKKRNSLIREQRAKKNIRALLEELREKNLINQELRDRLESYSGHSAKSCKKTRRPRQQRCSRGRGSESEDATRQTDL